MDRAYAKADKDCMVRKDNLCCLCHAECDGSLMRHRSMAVRDMITAIEIPRRRDGGPSLCHHCQREVFFKGGFLSLLSKRVLREARNPRLSSTSKFDWDNPPETTKDEDEAKQRFIDWRWPCGVKCPRCGTGEPYLMTERKIFRCRECRMQFSATSGTAFSGRKLSFSSVLKIMNAGTTNPHKLSQETGLTYKTTWSLTKRLAH